MKYILGEPYIEINSTCNLSCIYCYHENRDNTFLTKDIIYKLVESLKELGAKEIKISGGEPMLHPDFFDILRFIKKCGLKVNLVTNGTKINSNNAMLLKDLCDLLTISMDSWDQFTNDQTRPNSYMSIIRALEELKTVEAKSYYLGVVATKYNSDIASFIELGKKYRIQGIIFESIHREGKAKDIFDDYFMNYNEYQRYKLLTEELKKAAPFEISTLPGFGGSCMLIEDIPVIRPRIDYNGNVYLCRSFLNTKMSVGNIYEHNLSEILEGEKTENLIVELKKRSNECGKCKKCFCKGEICQGGCAAQAYNRSGTLFEVDDLCEWRKKQYINIIKEKIL